MSDDLLGFRVSVLGVRWIATEVFEAGEPNPYPDETPAVRRRFRAVPLDRHPVRGALSNFHGWHSLWRIYDRRAHAVVGYAWVRRAALRRRRLFWGLWAAGLAAAVFTVVLLGPADPRVVRDFSGELFVLLAAALLLITRRISAVLDRDHDEVGIRG